MAEQFDFAAHQRAIRELREATDRVLGTAYEMMIRGADFSSRPDYTAFSLVRFADGNLRYEPITADEFFKATGHDESKLTPLPLS